MGKITKKERVIKELQSRPFVSNRDLFISCGTLAGSSIISGLIAEGYDISKAWMHEHDRWGDICHYKIYSLGGLPE